MAITTLENRPENEKLKQKAMTEWQEVVHMIVNSEIIVKGDPFPFTFFFDPFPIFFLYISLGYGQMEISAAHSRKRL
jgi:hypothetical protein